MTKWEKFKCSIGFHGKEQNIGVGYGSVFIQGCQLNTVCRLWRCPRCGHETGEVTCPQTPSWSQKATAKFVRQTSRFSIFDKYKPNAEVRLKERRMFE